MEAHPGLFGIQMAATACLYNLSKGDLAQKIHPKILKQVVELTLTAMENFPNNHQVSQVINFLFFWVCDKYIPEKHFKAATQHNGPY